MRFSRLLFGRRRRREREREKKRERERDAKSSALHWLEKDRSLSLLSLSSFDFCTLFFALFFFLRALCLSHCCGEEREREKESTFVWVVSNGDDEIVVVVFLIFKGLLCSRKRWFWDVYQRRREKARERGRGRFGRNLSPERERKIVSFF